MLQEGGTKRGKAWQPETISVIKWREFGFRAVADQENTENSTGRAESTG